MSLKFLNKTFSPFQMQTAKQIRSSGRHILRDIANRPKIHQELSVVRTNKTKHLVKVMYKPRVVKINGCGLTIRKPVEHLAAHYAASQVEAV